MNNAVTTKEDILKISRELILKNGISSFSMRAIADHCNVAVGSIYNYYPSKADLLSATIESVWKDIVTPVDEIANYRHFTDCIADLFKNIKSGGEKYPGFLSIHALNFAGDEKVKGKKAMEEYFNSLKSSLIWLLQQDEKVRKDVFHNTFTEAVFVDYIFTLMITLLLRKENNCFALIELIENCIY